MFACGRGSVFLWRRCNTSGFVDVVFFFYNGTYGGVTLPQQLRWSALHGL